MPDRALVDSGIDLAYLAFALLHLGFPNQAGRIDHVAGRPSMQAEPVEADTTARRRTSKPGPRRPTIDCSSGDCSSPLPGAAWAAAPPGYARAQGHLCGAGCALVDRWSCSSRLAYARGVLDPGRTGP